MEYCPPSTCLILLGRNGDGFISLSRMNEKYGLAVRKILINESPLLGNEDGQLREKSLGIMRETSFYSESTGILFQILRFLEQKI